MSCPFCDIDPKKTRVIAKRGAVYVAMSNPRIVPGHLLVIPNRHVEKLYDLDAGERRDLFDAAIEFQEKVVRAFSCGADIRQHFMPFMAQSRLKVDHSHVHIHPRTFRDELYLKCQANEKYMFVDVSEEEMDRYSKLLGD